MKKITTKEQEKEKDYKNKGGKGISTRKDNKNTNEKEQEKPPITKEREISTTLKIPKSICLKNEKQ